MTVTPGDPAPLFVARSSVNPHFAFDTVAGRNLVLTFVDSSAADQSYLQELASSPLFNDDHAALFIVSQKPEDQQPEQLPLRIPGVRAFFDDGTIARLYGLERFKSGPVSFVLSPRLQIIGLVASPAAQHAEHVLSILQKIPHVTHIPPILAHPPILIIPHVFEPDLCRSLIQGYRTHGGEDSGFMRDVNGRTVEIRDASHKVRQDWNISSENKELIGVIQNRFKRRVVPEVQRAYQFEVTRMERYLVACYSAEDQGHFRAHRDNTTKGTAHRRFAVSVNLNAEDYDGGELRFPEFGRKTYRPPTGGCCVFSCSLLHEATPVTKGVRYVFLPFLYDEAARKIREDNFKYVGSSLPSLSGSSGKSKELH